MPIVTAASAIQNLYEDFDLLNQGLWIPDSDSIEASQYMLEHLAMLCIKAGLVPNDFKLQHIDNEEDN